MNSNATKAFNPFESRQCRTVRNALGQSLLTAITAGKWEPVSRAVRENAPVDIDAATSNYVTARVASYRVVFSGLHATGTPAGDTWSVALRLWDQGLFFECHEWLETTWRQSEGARKKMIQALIWSAGAYAQLEYGRTAEAGKLAARAIAGLRRYREQVPGQFDVDGLVKKLEVLDPIPPKFGSGRPAA